MADMSVLQDGSGLAAGRERAPAYRRVEELLKAERCVILDGGIATELGRRLPDAERGRDEALWGTWALVHNADVVRDVHRSYVEQGCDVISTNTWGLTAEMQSQRTGHLAPLHWMDIARRGVEVGREAIEQAERKDEVALAFSINGDIDGPARREFIELLPRAFEDHPPDLILLETITLIRDQLTLAAIEALVATGIPVWTSFRRCRHGVCGVFGQHWGGPEGDEFGRAARRLDEAGVQALLINCLPPDHVQGMLPWLRDFTDLPLGVYPNLGYFTDDGWSFDKTVDGEQYGEMAAVWRQEGAQIIGGCCGTRPEHVAGARARVRDMPAGSRAVAEAANGAANGATDGGLSADPSLRRWTDERGRRLYPLEVPDIVCEPGVFVPTHGSFLVWKYLFQNHIGDGRRCLDIGCGTGILAVQLALNGAAHVRALDIDDRAVANTLANAFRNDVADRVTAQTVDLFPWVPEERYEVIVASLYQRPTDPFARVSSHRLPDYWGRNLVDQLIAKLSEALAPEGVAYIVQLSILSQRHTADALAARGFVAQTVDYTLFSFPPEQDASRAQIARVEELSDAYHLTVGEEPVMVAYLLEVRHAP
jgi:S-methylmethionine-dependent homocysteine/selenocysteine methylase/SAM-dependent methyltransferase